MDKAIIRVLGQTPERVIPVMFNPTDYELTRNVKYGDLNVPGLPMPLLQFVQGESQQLILKLFLDSSDRVTRASPPPPPPGLPVPGALGASVEDRLRALRTLVTINSELHAPPVVRFEWGETQFEGVATQFTEKFQMFDEHGKCIRARCEFTLKSYIAAETLYRQTNPMSPDRTKTRVARAGERLDAIAAEEYGDPERWRVIAAANGLTRPRVLVAGTLLRIPPLE